MDLIERERNFHRGSVTLGQTGHIVPAWVKSLAERHDAPAFLAKNKQEGVPLVAVLISSACLLIVVGISYLLPQNIFVYIASAGGVTLLLNWLVIAFTYLRFRRRMETSQGNRTERPAGFPYAAATAIVEVLKGLRIQSKDFSLINAFPSICLNSSVVRF